MWIVQYADRTIGEKSFFSNLLEGKGYATSSPSLTMTSDNQRKKSPDSELPEKILVSVAEQNTTTLSIFKPRNETSLPVS